MKICPSCEVVSLIKYGKRNGKQRYKCKICKQIYGGNVSSKVDYKKIYNSFCFENSTYKQLSTQYNVTKKTIQKWLDEALFKKKISLSVKV